MCYFGQIVAGRLKGFGQFVPFEPKIKDQGDKTQGYFEDDKLVRLTAEAYEKLEGEALQAMRGWQTRVKTAYLRSQAPK